MRDDRPSATAYLIARSTYFLSRDRQVGYLVPEPSAELSRRFVHPHSRLRRSLDLLANSKVSRAITHLLERATIPGIKLHYALRKCYLEETARRALEDGLGQLVVLGAGFDTLALRLHRDFPTTEFFEVDHPATQREKRRVVETREALGSNLHFVALDLAHRSLEESLPVQAGYRTDSDTLFIAEGLLMYLAPAEVDLIFQFVQERSGPKSRFVFTFMETWEEGRIGFRRSSRAVDAWLRLRNESFKWGLGREQIAEFLAPRGFRAREIVVSENLRDRYLNSARLKRLPLAEGECICLAEPMIKE